ncbi:MAG: hypothetical protein AAFU55_00670 [Pseudomonadota bacterium]
MVFVAGHFGEWVQGRVGPGLDLVLVTLACPGMGVSARFEPAERFAVSQGRKVLSTGQCEALLARIGADLSVKVLLDVSLPPGGGAGMSTAALVALARAAGAEETAIPDICREIEGASDPLMLDRPDAAIWAPRKAQVVAFAPPPPAAEIVGGFWREPFRTDPEDCDFPIVDDLIKDWAKGPELAEAARIASASADRTTALRGPADDRTPQIAKALGALGYARAHTGSARAFIFAPASAPESAEAILAEAGYSHILRFATGGR